MADLYEEVIGMGRAELEVLGQFVQNLIEQKRRLEDSPQRIERIVEEYQLALGRQGGDPWVDPSGNVLGSYPRGAVVTHGGLWSSRVQMNMAEPGTDPTAWEPADGNDDAA